MANVHDGDDFDPPEEAADNVKGKNERITAARARIKPSDASMNEEAVRLLFEHVTELAQKKQTAEEVVRKLREAIDLSVKKGLARSPSHWAPRTSESPAIVRELSLETTSMLEAEKNRQTLPLSGGASLVDKLLAVSDSARLLTRAVHALFEVLVCSFLQMLPSRRAYRFGPAWWITLLCRVTYQLTARYPDLLQALNTSGFIQRLLNRLDNSMVTRWLLEGIRWLTSRGPSFVFSACITCLAAWFTDFFSSDQFVFAVGMWFLNEPLTKQLGRFATQAVELLRLGQAIILQRLDPWQISLALGGIVLRALCSNFERKSSQKACQWAAALLSLPGAVGGFSDALHTTSEFLVAQSHGAMSKLCQLHYTPSGLFAATNQLGALVDENGNSVRELILREASPQKALRRIVEVARDTTRQSWTEEQEKEFMKLGKKILDWWGDGGEAAFGRSYVSAWPAEVKALQLYH